MNWIEGLEGNYRQESLAQGAVVIMEANKRTKFIHSSRYSRGNKCIVDTDTGVKTLLELDQALRQARDCVIVIRQRLPHEST